MECLRAAAADPCVRAELARLMEVRQWHPVRGMIVGQEPPIPTGQPIWTDGTLRHIVAQGEHENLAFSIDRVLTLVSMVDGISLPDARALKEPQSASRGGDQLNLQRLVMEELWEEID